MCVRESLSVCVGESVCERERRVCVCVCVGESLSV